MLGSVSTPSFTYAISKKYRGKGDLKVSKDMADLLEYYYKKHGSKNKPKKMIIKKGELFFTPPMVDHAMKFLQYTEFITLGRGSRAKINYDHDTIKVHLI